MNLINEGVLPPDELDDRDERLELQELHMGNERKHEPVADIGNAAARDEVVLRLSKDAYKGMQEALSEHDRLCEMLSESRKSIGDSAAMRAALEAIADSARRGSISSLPSASLVLRTCEIALSAPTRNFDIGTAEERYKRWRAFCDSYYDCTECPCSEHPYCFPEWEQMPYAPDTKKEGEAKSERA